MTLAERFGANLVRIRKEAGLSQEQLALLASIHRTEVSMLERATRKPRIDTLVKLVGALEVTPNDLLDGIDWKPGEVIFGSFSVPDERAAG